MKTKKNATKTAVKKSKKTRAKKPPTTMTKWVSREIAFSAKKSDALRVVVLTCGHIRSLTMQPRTNIRCRRCTLRKPPVDLNTAKKLARAKARAAQAA